MSLFKKNDSVITVKNPKTNIFYSLELKDEGLQIGLPKAKPDQLKMIRYDEIKDVVYTSDIETISESKSPIGRAVAGGLLFGGAGAVVGAISGTGSKTKKVYHFYLMLECEDEVLVYEDTSVTAKGSNFAKELKNKVGI